MERLAAEFNGPDVVRAADVEALPDQGMAMQAGLNPDLIALPGFQAHFDQRGTLEDLEYTVVTDGLFFPRIARMRAFLDERVGVPGEIVLPRPGGGLRVSADQREVYPFRLAPLKLIFQVLLCSPAIGEHDEA